MRTLWMSAVALLAMACGPGEPEYETALEQLSPPTEMVDTLVSLRMLEGVEALSLVDIEVRMQIAGQQINIVRFELTEDLDGDMKFGVGDTLSITEPVNLYGPEAIGKEFLVTLTKKGEGNIVSVLDEHVWQP